MQIAQNSATSMKKLKRPPDQLLVRDPRGMHRALGCHGSVIRFFDRSAGFCGGLTALLFHLPRQPCAKNDYNQKTPAKLDRTSSGNFQKSITTPSERGFTGNVPLPCFLQLVIPV